MGNEGPRRDPEPLTTYRSPSPWPRPPRVTCRIQAKSQRASRAPPPALSPFLSQDGLPGQTVKGQRVVVTMATAASLRALNGTGAPPVRLRSGAAWLRKERMKLHCSPECALSVGFRSGQVPAGAAAAARSGAAGTSSAAAPKASSKRVPSPDAAPAAAVKHSRDAGAEYGEYGGGGGPAGMGRGPMGGGMGDGWGPMGPGGYPMRGPVRRATTRRTQPARVPRGLSAEQKCHLRFRPPDFAFSLVLPGSRWGLWEAWEARAGPWE